MLNRRKRQIRNSKNDNETSIYLASTQAVHVGALTLAITVNYNNDSQPKRARESDRERKRNLMN